MRMIIWLAALALAATAWAADGRPGPSASASQTASDLFVDGPDWPSCMAAAWRAYAQRVADGTLANLKPTPAGAKQPPKGDAQFTRSMQAITQLSTQLWARFPQQMDWLLQDHAGPRGAISSSDFNFSSDLAAYLSSDRDASWERALIQPVLRELGGQGASLAGELAKLSAVAAGDRHWLALYERACRQRRALRLAPLLQRNQNILFAKHQPFGSLFGIYLCTEYEGCQSPGESALCRINLEPERAGSGFATSTVVFAAKDGIVRDPVLHSDGNHVLFAWRKTRKHIDTRGSSAPRTGNYQIHEMDLRNGALKQLTTDDYYGAAFEPCYLPDGNILFSSSRIVQHITCGWGDCSNFFLMDREGRYQRRIGFDQTNTAFPTVLPDGRVLYTRRDYNDRGQLYAHALFTMNPDGTSQQEYYGNNTVLPTSFQHAKGIPGTDRVLGVIGGYHQEQGGKLVMIDVNRGRQDWEGCTLIPPQSGVPTLKNGVPDLGRGDIYGKAGPQYANPEPVDTTSCVVAIEPAQGNPNLVPAFKGGWRDRYYKIYYLHFDGRRELLAADPGISCLQPIFEGPRPAPPMRSSTVDWRRTEGTLYVQDVYRGVGLAGVERGAIKRLRLIEILYKPITIKAGATSGPGGFGHSVTPPALSGGTYDAKRILGEARVEEDGSSYFRVPARTPVYLQAVDADGRAIQTMRSWTTLMPGERSSCVGCHEGKNETPGLLPLSRALAAPPQELIPFHGPPRGFSYLKEVQPIWNKHCISCHKSEGKAGRLVLTDEPIDKDGRSAPRSYHALLANDPKKHITSLVNYFPRLAIQTLRPPREYGSIRSRLFDLLKQGHENVRLDRAELERIAAWMDLGVPLCGDYREANVWGAAKEKEYDARMALRRKMEDMEKANIEAMLSAHQQPLPTRKP